MKACKTEQEKKSVKNITKGNLISWGLLTERDFRVNLYRNQIMEYSKNQLIETDNQWVREKNQLIGAENQLIREDNQLIEKQKQRIYSIQGNANTKKNAWMIFEGIKGEEAFGRMEIMKITGLSPNAAGTLIHKLIDEKLIIPVSGKGKGKYKFVLDMEDIL